MRNEEIMKAFRSEEKQRRLWNSSMTRHMRDLAPASKSFINQVVDYNRSIIAEIEADDKLYSLLGY